MNSSNGSPPFSPDWAHMLGTPVNGKVIAASAHIDRRNGTVKHDVKVSPWRRRKQRQQVRQVAPRSPVTFCGPPAISTVVREPEPMPMIAQKQEKRAGQGMISLALTLLTFLMIGLLWVSFEAQYKVTLFERHQFTASAIEALSLDLGMSILALLALALARIGRRSTPERWGIVGCAGFSALMNYASADSSSWRSVLVYTLPSLFLAYIVDRAVSVIRRHFLGLEAERSPFAVVATVARVLGKALVLIAKGFGIFLLYLLRLIVAPASTLAGLRRAVIIAAKVPDKPVKAVVVKPPKAPKPPVLPKGPQPAPITDGLWHPRPGSLTAKLIDVANQREPLATIEPHKVAALASSVAKEIGLNPGTGRTQLAKWVRQLQAQPQPPALPAGSETPEDTTAEDQQDSEAG